jgi:hypothetical protein
MQKTTYYYSDIDQQGVDAEDLDLINELMNKPIR